MTFSVLRVVTVWAPSEAILVYTLLAVQYKIPLVVYADPA